VLAVFTWDGIRAVRRTRTATAAVPEAVAVER